MVESVTFSPLAGGMNVACSIGLKNRDTGSGIQVPSRRSIRLSFHHELEQFWLSAAHWSQQQSVYGLQVGAGNACLSFVSYRKFTRTLL
jgi:hypothetical protein